MTSLKAHVQLDQADLLTLLVIFLTLVNLLICVWLSCQSAVTKKMTLIAVGVLSNLRNSFSL